MPVQLPLQPAGVSLPAQPPNPTTFEDVLAVKFYQNKVDAVVGNFVH
jgi:hypothetical protein